MVMYQFFSPFHEDVPVGLREIGTEQVLQMLRAGIVMALYRGMYERVHHMLHQVFMRSKPSMGNVKRGSYRLEILEARPRKSHIAQRMSHPSALEIQLYFYAPMLLEECMQKKLVPTVHSYNSCIRLGYAVQVVKKVLDACTQSAVLGSIQTALLSKVFSNTGTVIFKVIGSLKEQYSPQLERMCYAGSD